MKKVRILSLDGGGIRGIVPAIVIQYVEEKLIEVTKNTNARIADYFDLIVGTSTGGILSCFYLTPNPGSGDDLPSSKYTAAKALEFYSEKGYSIFNESKRSSWVGLRQLFNSTRYSPKTLEKIFKEEFDNLKMSELLKPCLVTTYDLKSKTAVFFSKENPNLKDKDFLVRDVVRSTSAAPTYFPPAKIKNMAGKKMVNIDGGVFANNPAMCAYTESRKSKFDKKEYPSAGEMLILSIGTGGGKFQIPNEEKSGDWGVINWAKSIPEIMMDGSIDTVHTQMDNLFKAMDGKFKLNYKRINVPEDKRKTYSSDMADASPSNIEALKKAGEAALNDALKAHEDQLGLDEFIKKLVENE